MSIKYWQESCEICLQDVVRVKFKLNSKSLTVSVKFKLDGKVLDLEVCGGLVRGVGMFCTIALASTLHLSSAAAASLINF